MHVFCLCNFRGLFPFSDFSLDRQANQGGAGLYIFCCFCKRAEKHSFFTA